MKKKTLTILIVVLFVLLIGSYFVYKGVNLFMYNINSVTTENYNEFIKGLNIKNTMNINNVSEDDYLSFNDIKVRNDFKNFEELKHPESTDEFVKYVLYGENENVIASFWMGKTYSYVEMLKSDIEIFGTSDKRFDHNYLVGFLKSNNIGNDIELFKFLVKNKNVKNNIFTSVKKMKENYAIQFFSSMAIPTIDSITLIDGDYEGYIFNLKSDIRECSILHNGKRYVFTFLKTDYFTDEYINEILNTVVIS